MRNIIKKYQPDATTFYWDKYRGAHGTRYKFNKYDINNTQTYEWDEYNGVLSYATDYKFNKYFTTISYTPKYAQFSKDTRQNNQEYTWQKYNYVAKDTILGYSWDKHTPSYVWNKYEKLTNDDNLPRYSLEDPDRYSPAYAKVQDSSSIGQNSDKGDMPYFEAPEWRQGGNPTTPNIKWKSENGNWIKLFKYDITANDRQVLNSDPYGTNIELAKECEKRHWEVWIKYYDSITIDEDTGEKVYGNCFQYNGADFINKIGIPNDQEWCIYKYSGAQEQWSYEVLLGYDPSNIINPSTSPYPSTDRKNAWMINGSAGRDIVSWSDNDFVRTEIITAGSQNSTADIYNVFRNNPNLINNYPYMEIKFMRVDMIWNTYDYPINRTYPYDYATFTYQEVTPTYYRNSIIKSLNNSSMETTVNGVTYTSPSSWYIAYSANYDETYEPVAPYYRQKLDSIDVRMTNIQLEDIRYNGEPGADYPGNFIGQITSNNPNAYPQDGADGDYYYKAVGLGPGAFIETVTGTASEPNKYPNDDVQDGYYYCNKSVIRQANDEKTTYITTVTSVSKSAYPENGVQAGYWYLFVGGVNEERIKTVTYLPTYHTLNEAVYADYQGKTLYFQNNPSLIYVLTNPNKPFPDIVDDNGTLKWNLDSGDYTLYTVLLSDIPALLDSDGSIDGYTRFLLGTPNNNPNLYELLAPQTVTDNTPKSVIHTFTHEDIDISFLFNALCWNLTRTNNETVTEPTAYEQLADTQTNNNKYYILAYNYEEIVRDTARAPTSIYTTNRNEYPDNGWDVDSSGVKYWYIYDGPRTIVNITKGTYIGTVTSSNQNAYPAEGPQDLNWYEFKNIINNQEQGTFKEQITANNSTDYPLNGIYEGYWYVYTGEAEDMYYNTNYYLGTVQSSNANEYPLDGYVITSEGGQEVVYWYIRWSDEEGYTPVWNDHNILHGVNYKQNVNPDEDYIIGAVSMASIDFQTNDITSTSTTDGYKYYNTENMTNRAQRQIGIFNIVDVENQGGGAYKVTMYDNISKFDDYVDTWIEQQTYPVVLKTFFANLCNHFNVEYVAIDTMTNANFMVYDNFRAINISGKQILGYIAEAVGGFACANADGKIEIRTFTNKNISINNHKYVDYKRENYSVAKIKKLVIQTTANDVGVVATKPTGTEQYNIINNPLFYTDDESLNRSAASALITQLNKVQYVPGEVTLLEDPDIKCGDIITVNGNTFYVMEKELTESGVTLSCFGNRNRLSSNSSVNSDIIALRGKTNELTRTLEQTQSTITDISAGLQSQVTQTADSFNVEIGKLNQEITNIHAGLDGIKLSYNYNDQTASLTIGNITVRNLVGTDYVDQVVAGIDMTGYVQFNDLSRTGSTVINGSNITTGTISADRINLTGAISWSDLSADTRNTIYSLVSTPSGDTLPNYIKSTYIDSVSIMSPTIYGAEIYAGTSAQGYLKLSSTGINFYSNSHGAIFGLGYYAGRYDYPYIVLGQGVDSYGTDKGMIKKFSNGLWIGDSDCITDNIAGKGVGIFINFNSGTIWKAENGVWTQL